MAGKGGGAALAHIPEPQLTKFVHHVIDHVCGGQPVSYEQYRDTCPLDKFWLAVQETKNVVKEITLKKLTKEEVVRVLSALGEGRAGSVHDAVVARREELDDAMVRDALHGAHHLKDFDWNVKVSVSSDKVMELNEPLLTLHLHSVRGRGEAKDTCVEMTLPQVDALLQQLTQAQQTLTHMASQRPPP